MRLWAGCEGEFFEQRDAERRKMLSKVSINLYVAESGARFSRVLSLKSCPQELHSLNVRDSLCTRKSVKFSSVIRKAREIQLKMASLCFQSASQSDCVLDQILCVLFLQLIHSLTDLTWNVEQFVRSTNLHISSSHPHQLMAAIFADDLLGRFLSGATLRRVCRLARLSNWSVTRSASQRNSLIKHPFARLLSVELILYENWMQFMRYEIIVIIFLLLSWDAFCFNLFQSCGTTLDLSV